MKLRKFLFLLIFFSSLVGADPYSVLSLQGTTGQNGLEHSSSLLANVGLGYETDYGIYFDWVLGVNSKVIAEAILDHNFGHADDNRHSGKMDLTTGYKFGVTQRSYLKLGVGLQAAIFSQNCTYNFVEGKYICDKKYEYGPTYKVGYFVRSSSKLILGLEVDRAELSETRKYNGLSFVMNAKF